MKPKKSSIPPRKAPPPSALGKKSTPPAASPEMAASDQPEQSDVEDERIVSRPDGYHWVALDGRQEFGPFETIDDALADMHMADDEQGDSTSSESLHEAERDIGIADWIDPETGEPAEGQSPPHLEQE